MKLQILSTIKNKILKNHPLLDLGVGIFVGFASFFIRLILGGFDYHKIYELFLESLLHAFIAFLFILGLTLFLKISPAWGLINRLDENMKEGDIQKPLNKLLDSLVTNSLLNIDEMHQRHGKIYTKDEANEFYEECFKIGDTYDGTDLNVPSEFINKLQTYYYAHCNLQQKNAYKDSNRILLINTEDLHYDFLLNHNYFLRCYIDHLMNNISLFYVDDYECILEALKDEYKDEFEIEPEFAIWKNKFGLDTKIVNSEKIWLRIGLPKHPQYESLVRCFELLKDNSSRIIIKVNDQEVFKQIYDFLKDKNKIEDAKLRSTYKELLANYLKEQQYANEFEKNDKPESIIDKYLLPFIHKELSSKDTNRVEKVKVDLYLYPQKSGKPIKTIQFEELENDPVVHPDLALIWEDYEHCKKRIEKTLPFIKEIISKYNYHDILDTGTGTACESFELCKIGYNVTVNQVSPELASSIRNKAGTLSTEEKNRFKVTEYDWRELSFTLEKDSYDVILFLGNNLSVFHTQRHVERCLDQFYKILRKNGVIILDKRNYEKIKDFLCEVDDPTVEKFNDGKWYTGNIIFCGKDVQSYPTLQENSIDKENEYENIRFNYVRKKEVKGIQNLRPLWKDTVDTSLRGARFSFIQSYDDFKLPSLDNNPDFNIYVAYKNKTFNDQ